jgi:hypothetical protein
MLLEMLTVAQIVKKFPKHYVRRRFITVLTTFPIINQINEVHTLISCFFAIRFNKILPSLPR